MPLGLALLILTGICPLIAWRKASMKNFQRNFVIPLGIGLGTGLVSVLAGVRGWVPLVFFSASGFVVMTVAFEFWKGARARNSIRRSGFLVSLMDLTLMNKRRYGGFIIHLGAVMVFVGIIASSFFSQDETFTLGRGEEYAFGKYTIQFQQLQMTKDPEKDVVTASLDIFSQGGKIGELQPQKHFHHKSEQPMTEVKIRSTLAEDLYLVLADWDDDGHVTFHAFINPLVQFIWLGIAVMVLGGLFVLLPNRKPGPAVALQGKGSEVQVRDAAA
jgi:cytochrome c-type biogenesis protein CcmF